MIRAALESDTPAVVSILREAAAWLEASGMPMWRLDELDPARIAGDVRSGLFRIAESDGRPLGVVKIQLEDDTFWSDVPRAESVFAHRLAVRRDAAGRGISNALLAAAVEHALTHGRRFVRLDCEARRARLRAVYERFGFVHHSDRQVGPYFVARYEIDLGVEHGEGPPLQ